MIANLILLRKKKKFQMTVTWGSGYDIAEAVPLVQWGLKGESQTLAPAGTLTFHRNSMCGKPQTCVVHEKTF